MTGPEITAKLEEAEALSWDTTRSVVRAELEMMRAAGGLSASIADACREVHRAGWLRGYETCLRENGLWRDEA